MTLDLLVTNGHVITPDGRLGPDEAVGVRDGIVAAIGRVDDLPAAAETLDLDGRYLVPGLIDCHIHARSPGQEYKEDWTSATRAAAAGGVTTVLAMPNTDPIIDRPEHLRTALDLADRNAVVDFGQYAVVTSDNLDQIGPLDEAGAAGYKVFLGTTVGEIPPPTDGELVAAMERIADTGKRVGFHEENDEILAYHTERAKREGRTRPLDHARSRPVLAEVEAVARTVLFGEHTGCPVHMFHVTSGSAAEQVAAGKRRGVDVTAETTPQHLWFTEAALEEKGNTAKIQPPLRPAAEQDLLWEVGIRGRGVDCVATDHSPHTDAEKGADDPFGDTWETASGFAGLESAAPAMLTFAAEGRLSLERWVELHSTRPARIWGLFPRKGTLRVGADADFTVIEPDRQWTQERGDLRTKSPTTPWNGETFLGAVTHTFVRGSPVYDEGASVGEPGDGRRVTVGPTMDG